VRAIYQRHNFGCGAACLAFVLKIDYSQVVYSLGEVKAKERGFYCGDLVEFLLRFNRVYSSRYIKPRLKKQIYRDGVVVFIKRTRKYPAGHYLTYFNGRWMDSWINFQRNNNLGEARAGFRKKLPGIPIYALFPETGIKF